MPAVELTLRWTPLELRTLANRITLLPMIEATGHLDWLRESDGFGSCVLIDRESTETPSAVFVFNTGEIWSIDTAYLSFETDAIYISEMEKCYNRCLRDYSEFLRNLGVNPPYCWEAGITGAKDRRLARGTFAGFVEPKCVSTSIAREGIYDGEQLPEKALLPFFGAIYEDAGIRRPG